MSLFDGKEYLLLSFLSPQAAIEEARVMSVLYLLCANIGVFRKAFHIRAPVHTQTYVIEMQSRTEPDAMCEAGGILMGFISTVWFDVK